MGVDMAFHLKKFILCCRQISRLALDKVFRMLKDPGVIQGDMVGYEVQNQPDSTLCQDFSGDGQPLWSTKVFIDRIPMHAVGGAHHVHR